MNAIILSVGDELVLGQTVDTNSAWISQQLAAMGCDIAGHATVPDDQTAIEAAIRETSAKCDFLIISGGIGPTEDDLTRQALAVVMDEPLELNEVWLERLRGFFTKLGREMPKTNTIQAMIPRTATMIDNTCGTAAGIAATLSPHAGAERGGTPRSAAPGRSSQACKVFIVPGVPKEMKAMLARDVFPHIAQASNGAVILSRTLHTFGLGESSIAEKLGELMNRKRNPSVGTTVSQGIVSLRINARFPARADASHAMEATETACRAALGDLIFGADDDSLPKVIAESLASSRQTVATAESCTGGLLAKMLTDVPGSSDYFHHGWVTYSNDAKINRLGVSENLLNVYGAVSEPVVDAMAKAARRLAKSTYALAISGVAGPSGGTAAKPVGMVCIALASQSDAEARGDDRFRNSVTQLRTFQFPGDREMVRDRAAKMALAMLRYKLMDKPMPF